MPTTIHPFHELRALAEQCAQERADERARYGHTHDTGGTSWAAMGHVSRHIAVSVELNLLCDLTRPASRDAIARLVAAKVGWQPERVIGAVESSGAIRNRLYRKVGVAGWCSSAPDALSMIVAHLWPSEP